MKTKLFISGFVMLLAIAFFAFTSKTIPNSIPPIEPDGFYVKVCLQNVPVQYATVKITIGGQTWDQQQVSANSECYQYSKWHPYDYTGTIVATASYYYQGCWYWGSQSETGYFYREHFAFFTISNYTLKSCD